MPIVNLPRLDTAEGLAKATEIYIATCIFPNDQEAQSKWLASKSAKVKGLLVKNNLNEIPIYSEIFHENGGYEAVAEAKSFADMIRGATTQWNNMFMAAEILRVLYTMAHHEELMNRASLNCAAWVIEQCHGNGRVPIDVPSGYEDIIKRWSKHKSVSHMCLSFAYMDFALRHEATKGRLHTSHFLNATATSLPFMIRMALRLYDWITTYTVKAAREPVVPRDKAWTFSPAVLEGTFSSDESEAFLQHPFKVWFVLSPEETEAANRYVSKIRS